MSSFSNLPDILLTHRASVRQHVLMHLRPRLIALSAAVIAVIFLICGFLVDPGTYQAFSAGVQAVGVLVALAFGVITLQSDNKDRRVDRVIAYQNQIAGGELQLARQRLIEHMLA